MNNKLIIAAVSTIVAALTFYLTKNGIESSILGAFTFHYKGFLIIFPTAAITSVLFSLFVYLTLKSFLYGVTKTAQRANHTLIPKDLQIACLTVITAWAAFNIENELLKISEYGVINLEVTNDFTIFIPTVVITTVALAWVVFTVLMQFLASLSQEAGRRQSEALHRIVPTATSEAKTE